MNDFDNKKLLEPIPYKWRIQSVNEWNANFVAYIDARDLMDRLDAVVGPDNWMDEYVLIDGKLFCKLSLYINGHWVSKMDCGTESNMDKEKGQASDAFKRAGVKWGVGRFLYSIGVPKTKSIKDKGKWHPAVNDGKDRLWPNNFNSFCEWWVKENKCKK